MDEVREKVGEEATQRAKQAPEEEPKEEIRVEKGEATPEQIEEIKQGNYYTIKQLAAELSYSITWITYLCQWGRIKAIKPLGGHWRIPPSEVERIKKEGMPPLPREEPKQPEGEIVVEGEHRKRVVGKQEDKEKQEESMGWPLSIFLE